MDERELSEFEARTRRDVADEVRALLAVVTRTATAVYVAAAGDTRHKLPEAAQGTLRDYLSRTLGQLAEYEYAETRATLQAAGRTALAAGARGTGLDVRTSITLPLDIRHAMTALTAGVRDDLRAARQLARAGSLERYGDVMNVVAAAKAALNRLDRTAVWLVHRAHNEGAQRAIERAAAYGASVVSLWRAERDACLTCLGYAGALAEPGESFRPVVEVADPSGRLDGPVWGPPAHPHCRCRLEVWDGPLEVGSLDLPYALRREAQRSIATGAARASRPARARAAARLVNAAGLLIPKTVVRRARRTISARSGGTP